MQLRRLPQEAGGMRPMSVSISILQVYAVIRTFGTENNRFCVCARVCARVCVCVCVCVVCVCVVWHAYSRLRTGCMCYEKNILYMYTIYNAVYI